MKTKSNKRRAFLLAGVGGAGAVVAAAAVLKPSEGAVEAAADAPRAGDGYRETEHIQKYYKTTEV